MKLEMIWFQIEKEEVADARALIAWSKRRRMSEEREERALAFLERMGEASSEVMAALKGKRGEWEVSLSGRSTLIVSFEGASS